jgi:hypothetical protein
MHGVGFFVFFLHVEKQLAVLVSLERAGSIAVHRDAEQARRTKQWWGHGEFRSPQFEAASIQIPTEYTGEARRGFNPGWEIASNSPTWRYAQSG